MLSKFRLGRDPGLLHPPCEKLRTGLFPLRRVAGNQIEGYRDASQEELLSACHFMLEGVEKD
jgi:hypothetical protein